MPTKSILMPVIILTMMQNLCSCVSFDETLSIDSNDEILQSGFDDKISYSGQQVYDQVCAKCHQSGLAGAPRVGHPEDWINSSWLWNAVLVEHAKSGYMNMPAKGGASELNDRLIHMSVEYMLSMTYSEMNVADRIQD